MVYYSNKSVSETLNYNRVVKSRWGHVLHALVSFPLEAGNNHDELFTQGHVGDLVLLNPSLAAINMKLTTVKHFAVVGDLIIIEE